MDYENFRNNVGLKIKEIRISKNITQEQMENFGDYSIPFSTFKDIELGYTNPTLKNLYKIAKRLEVEPKDLLDV